MNTPLVSIIIPTYNRAHLIGETLDSVRAQTYNNWECIVVDDGSSDETDKLLAYYCEKDNRFQYHHRTIDRPKGANACRNYGFEVSKGSYVNWFDDDVMLEDFLMIKVSEFTPEVDLVICSGFFVDKDLLKKKTVNLELPEKSKLFQEYLLWNLKILTPSILFKKSFLEGKKLFLSHLSRGQETEFFSRIFFNLDIDNFIIINKSLFLYRQHENNKTTRNKKYHNKHKESESFIYIENLKRSILLKNKVLIQFCYEKLVGYFFSGINYNHSSNSKIILKNMLSILIKKNKILLIQWVFFGNFSLLIKQRSYTLKKKLKGFKIEY